MNSTIYRLVPANAVSSLSLGATLIAIALLASNSAPRNIGRIVLPILKVKSSRGVRFLILTWEYDFHDLNLLIISSHYYMVSINWAAIFIWKVCEKVIARAGERVVIYGYLGYI